MGAPSNFFVASCEKQRVQAFRFCIVMVRSFFQFAGSTRTVHERLRLTDVERIPLNFPTSCAASVSFYALLRCPLLAKPAQQTVTMQSGPWCYSPLILWQQRNCPPMPLVQPSACDSMLLLFAHSANAHHATSSCRLLCPTVHTKFWPWNNSNQWQLDSESVVLGAMATEKKPILRFCKRFACAAHTAIPPYPPAAPLC